MNNKLYISSNSITKTSALLLPALEVNVKYLYDNLLVNAFLNDALNTDALKGDRYLYCLFDFNIEDKNYSEFLEELQGESSFVGMYSTEHVKRTMVVFQVPEKWNEVYDQFVIGKYTKIPRDYVNTYFKPRLYDGQDKYGISRWKASKNYMILTGDPIIRKQIETDLGVTLPEDAEVFSKPNNLENYGITKGGYRYY